MNRILRRLPILLIASIGVAPQTATTAAWPFSAPDAKQRLLAVDEAFQPRAALWQGGHLSLEIGIAEHCYLYRDKLRVEPVDPAGYLLGAPSLAAGETHEDEHFGKVAIFRNLVKIGFSPHAKQPPKQLRLIYQGCAENLVCYPPQSRLIDVVDANP